MIFCAWQQILFLFANSAVPWNHRALFDQMSVEYRGSQQNLSNYSQKGAKGTLRMQTYKKGGSTEHKNAVRTSADSHTSRGQNTLPLIIHSPPIPPSYLQWTANYIVKCLQALPARRLLLSARQSVAEKNTTPTIKQSGTTQASHWPLEVRMSLGLFYRGKYLPFC